MILTISSKHEMKYAGAHRYYFIDNGIIIKSCSTKEEVKLYLSIIGKKFKKIYRDWNNSFIYNKDKSKKGYRSAYIILE